MIYFNWVRITHLPTGLTVECNSERSIFRMKQSCLSRLKGMLWALKYSPRTNKLKRTYIIPDGKDTIPDLETGDCINRDLNFFKR